MFPPLLDENYSAIFQDCGEWNDVQGYNKATDPLVRRGAMALYRMMCWAPFSMSIGSSLQKRQENKKKQRKRNASFEMFSHRTRLVVARLDSAFYSKL